MIYLKFYIYFKFASPSLHLRCGVLNKLTLLKPKKVSL